MNRNRLRKRLRAWWVAVIVVAAVSSTAVEGTAQPVLPGDWIAGDLSFAFGGIVGLDPNSPAPAIPNPFFTGRPRGYMNWISMHPNNDFILTSYSLEGTFGVVTKGGLFATLVLIKDSPNGHALDEDGLVFASTSGQDEILDIDVNARTKATFNQSRLTPTVNSVTIDRDTGDLLVGSYQGGVVVALDRVTGRVKNTLATGLGLLTSIDYDPVTGGTYVTTLTPPELRRIERTGVVTTIGTFGGANGCKVDEETGNLVVCALSRVAEVRPDGTVNPSRDHTQPPTPVSYNFTSVEIYGSRKLSGFGSGKPGTTYSLLLSFPRSPNQPYVVTCGLSGFRPGVPLPDGRRVNLRFDVLANLVLASGGIPGLFRDFVGMLDGTGKPVGNAPTIAIPANAPPGLRLYLAAVAVNPGFPGRLDVANSWAMSIQ